MPIIAVSTKRLKQVISGAGMNAYLARLPDSTDTTPTLKADAIDKALRHNILAAQARVEMRTEQLIIQHRIKTTPVDSGLVIGTDYEMEDDGYDFHGEDWQKFGQIQMRFRPVVSVERVTIRLGQSRPHRVIDFPEPWIVKNKRMGEINIVPYLGFMTGSPAAMGIMPLLQGAQGVYGRGATGQMPFVPQAVAVDYTAGYLPRTFNPDTDEPLAYNRDSRIYALLEAIENLAAARTLETVQNAIGAGGGSVSTDGLSLSFQNNRFENAIKSFSDKADAIIQEFNADKIIMTTL